MHRMQVWNVKKDTQRGRRVRYIKLQDDGRIRIGIIGTGANVSVADWHTGGIIHDRRARISAVYNRCLLYTSTGWTAPNR